MKKELCYAQRQFELKGATGIRKIGDLMVKLVKAVYIFYLNKDRRDVINAKSIS